MVLLSIRQRIWRILHVLRFLGPFLATGVDSGCYSQLGPQLSWQIFNIRPLVGWIPIQWLGMILWALVLIVSLPIVCFHCFENKSCLFWFNSPSQTKCWYEISRICQEAIICLHEFPWKWNTNPNHAHGYWKDRLFNAEFFVHETNKLVSMNHRPTLAVCVALCWLRCYVTLCACRWVRYYRKLDANAAANWVENFAWLFFELMNEWMNEFCSSYVDAHSNLLSTLEVDQLAISHEQNALTQQFTLCFLRYHFDLNSDKVRVLLELIFFLLPTRTWIGLLLMKTKKLKRDRQVSSR